MMIAVQRRRRCGAMAAQRRGRIRMGRKLAQRHAQLIAQLRLDVIEQIVQLLGAQMVLLGDIEQVAVHRFVHFAQSARHLLLDEAVARALDAGRTAGTAVLRARRCFGARHFGCFGGCRCWIVEHWIDENAAGGRGGGFDVQGAGRRNDRGAQNGGGRRPEGEITVIVVLCPLFRGLFRLRRRGVIVMGSWLSLSLIRNSNVLLLANLRAIEISN